MLWEKDQEEYCLRHLVENRPPRTPQELPASVGSAFDSWVKSNIHAKLFGSGHDPKYEFEALFESSVEAHNRDIARLMGLHCFDNYVATGSYDELLELMEGAQEAPTFETNEKCIVNGVPIAGKPDARFISRHGIHFILDWKVKGYCSKYGASPCKGYALCRDGLDWEVLNLTAKQIERQALGEDVQGKHSRSHEKEHVKYLAYDFNGVIINEGYLETCSTDWATQLAMYGWMMGETTGDENCVTCIDELVCKYMGPNKQPLIRVANHKARISKDYQHNLANSLKYLWESLNMGWVFRDMSKKDSIERFEVIQRRANGMASDGSAEEDWYNKISRPSFR